jgi:phosphoglycolate phosphatase-like HAD superfamily hydrolase
MLRLTSPKWAGDRPPARRRSVRCRPAQCRDPDLPGDSFAPTWDGLLASLGWDDLADLVLSPTDAGQGRPYADMNLTADLRLRVEDVRSVAVVRHRGRHPVGLWAGAGVVVGVLTGSCDRSTLCQAGATHVLESVADLGAMLATA